MIDRIISFSIQNKLVVGIFTMAIIVAGIWSMFHVPIDAVPDITNNQVQVITQAPNLGTEDIEQFVTYPIEVAMANLPGIIEIRSVSRFGLSVVTIVFEDEMGTYLPRQLVSEKLTEIKEEIPRGFGEPSMGPISTGLGEIFQYTLQVDSTYRSRYSSTDLRTIQDWIIRRQMAMVPGVIEVNAFGGKIKQYEVAVNPDELKAIGLTITDIFTALELNNENTGGAYIEKNHQANFIRGEGLVRSLEDIEDIVVKSVNNTPIRIRDVADVRFGYAVRYGAFTKDGQGEAVGGMILMLKGANSNDVIDAVKERIARIEESLPEGVHIEPFLDRSDLISRTTSTVASNLIEGGLIVIFVLVLLLGNWRGGVIVASTIPLSLLSAFILMHVFGVWANLMSLGAIDFGIIVDGAVIIVEGTVFSVQSALKKHGTISGSQRRKLAAKASSSMMNSAFFGQLIILIVFLPILALEGIEGKMFIPMALTFIFAMIGAIVLCLTYVPMMSAWFLRVPVKEKQALGSSIVSWFERRYRPLLTFVLRHSVVIVITAAAILGGTIIIFTRLGGEFIPQLDEGDIAFHIIMKPGTSLTEVIETSTRVEQIVLEQFPEAEHVMTRIGVADVPTDPMPMDIGDVFVILKPKEDWVSANTKEELISKMKAAVSVLPGVNYEFTQPIEMRFNELISGVREDVAVKLFGEDIDILADKAEEIGAIISTVPGVADMRVEATKGLPQITVKYQRDKIAQYGLNIATVNRVIESAFAGGHAGLIFEGEKRFDLVVRLDTAHRNDIGDLRSLYINLPNGAQIPIQEVAEISYKPGPMQISRDNTNRRTYVGINVRGRDIKSLVDEIRQRLDAELTLPPGYYIEYGGAFENLERATSRIQVVVPIALALIFILIFLALRSFTQTVMIYMAIPFAAIGGVLSLYVRDMPFSISAGVGFIVLFGVAVLNGLVLVNGFNELKREGVTDIGERIISGTTRRIRPILLTASTDILGFLPMALSTSAGAEVQRPLATVVIGGLFTSTILTLLILPIFYKWIESSKNWKLPFRTASVWLFAGLFPCAVHSGFAQEKQVISLHEAVEMAVREYPSVRAAALEPERFDALQTSAIDFGSTSIFAGAEEVGPGDPGIRTLLGVQQTGIDVFGSISGGTYYGTLERAAYERYLDARRRMKRDVRLSYAHAVAAKQIYYHMQMLDSLYASTLRASRQRYQAEDISRLELLAVQTQARHTTMRTSKASAEYRDALSTLNKWLGENADYDVDTSMTDLVRFNAYPDGQLPLNHPLLRAVQLDKEAAAAKRRHEIFSSLPTFNLGYSRQRIGGISEYYSFQLGVTFRFPVFASVGAVEEAAIREDIASLRLREHELEYSAAYTIARRNLESYREQLEFYMSSAVPAAIEQRVAAKQSYKSGAIGYIEFLQNIKTATEIEIESVRIRERYLQSLFELEYFLQAIETK
ncbi:MAG: CusA/CzcA family heavy metal efflux RND transporter [Ectothiorhodospiraceae bacterium]|nr:CusA/CzcA family heavy metal efflux RND transporter [Ectothiorhodospiraceae bacterium]